MWQASPQRLITRSDCLSRRIAQACRIRGDAGNICDTRTQKNGVVSIYSRIKNLIAADKNTIKRLGLINESRLVEFARKIQVGFGKTRKRRYPATFKPAPQKVARSARWAKREMRSQLAVVKFPVAVIKDLAVAAQRLHGPTKCARLERRPIVHSIRECEYAYVFQNAFHLS